MKGEILISTKREEYAVSYLTILLILLMVIIISISINMDFDDLHTIPCMGEMDSEIRTEAITIGDKAMGALPPFSSKNDVLEELTSIYIEKLKINEENIISVKILGDIRSEKKVIESVKIVTPREMAKNIFELSKNNDDIVKVQIETKEIETFDIEPTVTVINTNSLYMGEMKKKVGEEGLKEVVKEVTYSNLEKLQETIADENIVKRAESTIVYNGVKNPIKEGVAFLNHPTGGGIITSTFGHRWNSFHNGIDIGKDTGTDVLAAFEGKVLEAGYNHGGYGNLVVIEHENNIQTYYAHLNMISVRAGEYIKKGCKIGEVGSTGFSTGPHLHFEVRLNDIPVNPLDYIIK